MSGLQSPIFVVQRHDASRLHFDFRIQVGNVLASWAVPKGPSLDPRERRLAKQVENHALGYARFEGRIGEGYGAGTVIVWDTGPLTNLTERDGRQVPLQQGITEGHVKIELHGQRLTGAFALTRTSMHDDPSNWILVKVADQSADRLRHPAAMELRSVLSSKTNQDFEKA